MGFTVPRRIYKLEFDGEKYAGIVVRVRAMSFATLLDIENMRRSDEMADRAEMRAQLDEFHGIFVDHLVDWNLEEEDGAPVPLTVEGLRSQEGSFVTSIIAAWRDTPTEVPAPLGRPSSDGDPSVELSVPMESLSESLAS
jgi:hypothetical protein